MAARISPGGDQGRVTGFIVESEADAVAAIARARRLDRRRIRETFERRFTRRMAEAYVESYQALLASAHSSASFTD
jgi:hypothetical protein